MRKCPNCSAQLTHDAGCDGCGARRRRDFRGLVTGPVFAVTGYFMIPDSRFAAVMFALASLVCFATLMNFRWHMPEAD